MTETCPCCGREYPRAYGAVLEAFDKSEKPIAQYALAKELKISYRQVIRILQQLQKASVIELDHTEPNVRGGKLEKNFWRKVRKTSRQNNSIREVEKL